MKKEEQRVEAAWTPAGLSSEWKYVEARTDRILGSVDRLYGSNEYAAYLRGQVSGSALGQFTTERGAKSAVEAAVAALKRRGS